MIFWKRLYCHLSGRFCVFRFYRPIYMLMRTLSILRFCILALFFISSSTAYSQFWQQTNGVGGDETISVTVTGSGHIFVGSRGLHRSTDGGITWKQLFTNAPMWSVKAIAVQPSGRLILSLVTSDINGYSGPLQNGIYVSDNDAVTWTYVDSAAYSINGFAQSGDHIYAASIAHGIYSSADGSTG